jgi:hypothetical protein
MNEDDIILKSGTKVYANHHILGIAPIGREVDGCILTEGYDGVLSLDKYNIEKNDYEPRYTKCELYEIADIAIARWNQFKRDVVNGVHKTKPDAITSKESS